MPRSARKRAQKSASLSQGVTKTETDKWKLLACMFLHEIIYKTRVMRQASLLTMPPFDDFFVSPRRLSLFSPRLSPEKRDPPRPPHSLGPSSPFSASSLALIVLKTSDTEGSSCTGGHGASPPLPPNSGGHIHVRTD